MNYILLSHLLLFLLLSCFGHHADEAAVEAMYEVGCQTDLSVFGIYRENYTIVPCDENAKTIQEAVYKEGNASRPKPIIVLPGKYKEGVIIRKSRPVDSEPDTIKNDIQLYSLYPFSGIEEHQIGTIISGDNKFRPLSILFATEETHIAGFSIVEGKSIDSRSGFPDGSFIKKINEKKLYYRTTEVDTYGGGVFIQHSDVRLSYLRVYDNLAQYGGGIFIRGLENGSKTLYNPTIENSYFYFNSAVTGGGMYIRESSPRLRRIIVADNKTQTLVVDPDPEYDEKGGTFSFTKGAGILTLDAAKSVLDGVIINNNHHENPNLLGADLYMDYLGTTYTGVYIESTLCLNSELSWYIEPRAYKPNHYSTHNLEKAKIISGEIYSTDSPTGEDKGYYRVTHPDCMKAQPEWEGI